MDWKQYVVQSTLLFLQQLGVITMGGPDPEALLCLLCVLKRCLTSEDPTHLIPHTVVFKDPVKQPLELPRKWLIFLENSHTQKWPHHSAGVGVNPRPTNQKNTLFCV